MATSKTARIEFLGTVLRSKVLKGPRPSLFRSRLLLGNRRRQGMGLATETPIEVHSSSVFYGSSPEQLISDISHEPASHSAPERSAANSVVGTNVAH